MSAYTLLTDFRQLPVLLRGEPQPISAWVRGWTAGRMWLYVAVILAGAGAYGGAMGSWRAPQQAVYTAIKFPLVIILTSLGNALLNGMLASLLGLNIGFRQCLLVIFMSFTIAAAILGSFSPLMLFVVWNTPPAIAATSADFAAYGFMQLATVAIIAFAGVMANVRLVPLLRELSGSYLVALRVLFAWLAGNLLLGSQIVWVLRPFIGNPAISVEFLTADKFEGNFFEAVFHALRQLIFS
jgi:hypothetical protein